MNPATSCPGYDGFYVPQQQTCGSYEPSIASSTISSQDSVFSDAASAQSSIASSISDDFRSSQEEYSQSCAAAYERSQDKASRVLAIEQQKLRALLIAQDGQQSQQSRLSYADVTSVPSEQRQHPRRSSLARNQKPPSLVRQRERKINFVDNLVDSATEMVEVIWPLSVVPCHNESGSGRGVLPLRTYIEETLRRSRTSYSTLQVALYYLILIMPYVPKSDFTMEQEFDCPADRALMCGRRMFLAALVLASKYLQDRNYSAKAWSKMSGLKADEINTNERTFLSKVCWKLHIPEPLFKRWTDVVLKYAPGKQPPTPGCGFTWKSIVPMLTPELDTVPMPESTTRPPVAQCPTGYGFASATTPTPARGSANLMPLDSTSQEGTPTPTANLPRYLEPKPDMAPPTPALVRMGPLPTPQMTPSTIGSNTPAASVCGSRRPSICSAMAMAQKVGMQRCTLDPFSGALPTLERFPPFSRRTSFGTASSGSSPESLMSDRTRSSRASSISSVSTVSTNASLAPNRACMPLARQATWRNASRLPTLYASAQEEKEGTAAKPIVIADDAEMTSSPEAVDFTINDKAMYAPHRHSKHAPHHPSVPTTDKGRKRTRPRGGRRSDLQDEIRFQLEDDLDGMEIDDEDEVLPSAAVEYAAKMLSRPTSAVHTKGVQPPASLSNRDSQRIPMQKNEGKKRACCSTHILSSTPLTTAAGSKFA